MEERKIRVKRLYTNEEIFGDLTEFYIKKKANYLRKFESPKIKRIEKKDLEVLYLLIGKLVKKGKRIKMCQKMLQILELLKINAKKEKKKMNGCLMECVRHIVPYLRLKSKRVGGMIYKLPIPLEMKQEYSKGLKWLAKSNKNKKMALVKSLVEDITLSKKGMGDLLRNKENDYRIASVNRPFVKYLK